MCCKGHGKQSQGGTDTGAGIDLRLASSLGLIPTLSFADCAFPFLVHGNGK